MMIEFFMFRSFAMYECWWKNVDRAFYKLMLLETWEQAIVSRAKFAMVVYLPEQTSECRRLTHIIVELHVRIAR